MTYECDYMPTPDNGHWHTTKLEADQCIENWKAWRTVPFRASNKKIKDYSNRPSGGRPDMDNRSLI
jgi:hypothetical protein